MDRTDSKKRFIRVAFFLTFVVAVSLRFTGLTFDSFWLDEGYQTVVESYGAGQNAEALLNFSGKLTLIELPKPKPISVLLSNFRSVDPLCPPLYAIVMNRWLTIFGGSDFSMRALSAAISTMSVVATGLLASLLLGPLSGCFSALLQAVSPFDIAYGQEARMYSLIVLMATLSGGALTLLCTRRQSATSALYALLYAFSTWALLSTHYTALFFWAGEIVVALAFAAVRRDWLLLAWLGASQALIAALCYPWFHLFLEAAKIRSASFYVSRSPSLWWPFYALLVRIPFNWVEFLAGKRVMAYLFPIYGTALWLVYEALRNALPHLKTFTLSTAKVLGIGVRRQADEVAEKRHFDAVYIFLLAALVLPQAGVWLVDLVENHRVVEISRYVISTSPALYMLSGAGLVAAMRRFKWARYLFILHISLALANNAYHHLVHQRENWRQAAQIIEDQRKPEEIVYVSQYYDLYCLDRYLTGPIRQIGLSPALGQEKIKAVLFMHRQDCPTFWILTGQEGDRVFAMVPTVYHEISHLDLHHALHLRHYRVGQ
jgi:uncharacterized membrane protein